MQRTTFSASLLIVLTSVGLGACSATAEDSSSAGAGAPSGPTGSGGSGGGVLLTGGTSSGSGGSTGEVCTSGQTRSCFPWDASKEGQGACQAGTQSCEGSGELGTWGACLGAVGPEDEICDDGIDQDCDGADASCGAGGAAGAGGSGGGGGGCVPTPEKCGNGIDEDCDGVDQPCSDEVCQSINLFGDCLTVSCPANAPYPKSCNVFFSPGDERGCVASTPTSSVVYFQAGDQCNVGLVTGTLCCSKTPQAPLTQQSCPINKPQPIHATSKSECPAIKK
ncbi:MAG: hypothetical protein KJ015_24000 [Myxococcales bacterium]|nr:hypothetical protein [Sorangiineae bacterium PRO1]MCL4753244.1 hypothetical protein [Myxococcales bacterium]